MKKKKQNPFKRYLDTLKEEEAIKILDFFAEYDRHSNLPKKEKQLMREDFENAILFYASKNIAIDEMLKRLEIANLGGFYSRPSVAWFSLDNAAKIYPLSMKNSSMAVFRLAVYLKNSVIPEILQIALTFTVKRFPSFASTLKAGFFWHYLSATKKRYTIEKESDVPCKPMKIAYTGSQAFRVLYYQNRISVEFFHVLTDGTGAMTFLKTLLSEYLRLLGFESQKECGVLDINAQPTAEETVNEFHAHAKKIKKMTGFEYRPAIQMSGKLAKIRPCQIIHFKIDLSSLKAASEKKNVTVTAYILEKILLASKKATEENKGNVNVQVPVNMRKFYPSNTLLNFSMFCGIEFPINEIRDEDSLYRGITEQLKSKASFEEMDKMLDTTELMVNSLRLVPLFLKNVVAHIIYGITSDKTYTNTLSNLGVVTLPDNIASEIKSFDFVLGTAITNRISCGLVTYNKTATLSITKMTADPTFEEEMYRLLTTDKVIIAVEGSPLYAN